MTGSVGRMRVLELRLPPSPTANQPRRRWSRRGSGALPAPDAAYEVNQKDLCPFAALFYAHCRGHRKREIIQNLPLRGHRIPSQPVGQPAAFMQLPIHRPGGGPAVKQCANALPAPAPLGCGPLARAHTASLRA